MANDNYYTINDILSKIDINDYIQALNVINVEKSKNVNISGNTLINNVNIIVDNHIIYEENEKQIIDIKFTDNMSDDKFQRAIMNIDYMERFIFECNRNGVCPTFRYYGLFSHLSSLRSSSNSDEYNQLILKEKKIFEQMLELNYKIKLIISLDIPIILTKWGYSIQETNMRIANLCDNIDDLTKNHNIEIVIDENNSMDAMYILDKCLLIRAVNIDPSKKYNLTKYETNKFVINNFIKEFDSRFAYLRYQNNIVKKNNKG